MTHKPADVFKRITTGVYVIGVAHGEKRNAFTAAWVMQVSFNPLLLAVSINPDHSSYSLLNAEGVFSVNVLRREHIELARHFGTRSGPDVDKLSSISWRSRLTGAPILADALAHFDCKVVRSMPAGDHELVIGQVVDGAIFDPNADPMTYAETGDMDGSSALYPSTF